MGLAVAMLLVATASSKGEVRRIRLCADPSNLPFSSQSETEPGFEVEVARALAAAIGADFSILWLPTVREVFTLRQLYEGRCDLLMGMPLSRRFTDDKPRLIFSVPYYVMRPAVVAPSLGPIRALDDLKSKLVGVQAMTLNDELIYTRGYNRKVYVNAADTFTALVKGDVDAAVLESPMAGWYARKNPGFRATEITDAGRELEVGAALRKTDEELKDAVDRAIRQLEATQLPAIFARYGLTLAQVEPQAAPATPDLRAARSTYLTQCSQCHGVDAKGTAAAANLQTFKGSEDDFLRIVQNGRPGTAMTPWKGLISEAEIRNVARYIKQMGAPNGPQPPNVRSVPAKP